MVVPSYQEGFCIPAMDSLGFGNPIICNDVGGLRDYVSFSNGALIINQNAPITGMHTTFPWLSNGFETWKEINIVSLGLQMRYFYESRDQYYMQNLRQHAKETPKRFSYEIIGGLIKDTLNA